MALFDQDGYPSEEALKEIREWGARDYESLMGFVRTLWRFAPSAWRQDGDEYHVSTVGWSGNEALIGALQDNKLFWTLCWESSHRCGHYVFKIRKVTKNEVRSPD